MSEKILFYVCCSLCFLTIYKFENGWNTEFRSGTWIFYITFYRYSKNQVYVLYIFKISVIWNVQYRHQKIIKLFIKEVFLDNWLQRSEVYNTT